MASDLDDLNTIAARVAKQKKIAAARLDLEHAAEGTSPARSSGSARDVANRATYGMLEGLSGVAQSGLDLASHIPGALGRAAGRGEELVRTKTLDIGKTLPKSSGMLESGAETAGEMLPSILAPGGPAVGGALAGATQFQPSRDETDRESARAFGAGAGMVGGKVLDLLGQGATKVINSKEINRTFRALQDEVAEADPALSGAKGKIGNAVERKRMEFQRRSKQALDEGDKIPPFSMSVGGADKSLKDLQENLGQVVNPDKKAQRIMDNIVDLYAPETKIPSKLSVGGREFVLDPTGQYVTKDGVYTLPPRLKDAALKSQGVVTQPAVKYSQLRGTLEELDNYLDKADAKNASVKTLQSARDVLQTRLDSATTPTIRRLQTNAGRFYDKNLKEFDKPEIKGILDEPDPLNRVNKAVDVALGSDPETAEVVSKLLGSDGAQGVRNAVVKKALDHAFDKKAGQIDAVKFSNFLGDKKALGPFLDRDSEKSFAGIKNLLRDDALRHGESPAPSLSHPSGSFGLAFGMGEIMRGHITQGAGMMASATLVGPTFRYLERLMNDKWGRNLLVAASRAKPNSPRMANIVSAMTRRFGPVIGATAAQVGGQ